MGIQDALRFSRRAGRVAHRRGGALVEIRFVHQRIRLGKHRLVVQHSRRGATGADDDNLAHARLRSDLLPQRQQRLVDDHQPIVRDVDDERELVWMQPKVQCMEDRARHRDTEVRLEVLMMIPPECRDALAGRDAERPQRAGQPPGARGKIRIRVSMQRPIRDAGYDLAPRKQPLRMPEDRRQREGKVHHQAVHERGLYQLDCRHE